MNLRYKIPELGKVFYACTGRTYEGEELEYHKKKLNKQYLYARAMKILSKFLLDSNINFDRCMV